MKVPTDGTSVYNAITYTGDGTANRTVSTTIQPDLLIQMNPSGNDHDTIDRLRGVTRTLYTNLTYADDYNTNVNKMLSSMTNTGFVTGSDGSNYWNASGQSKGAWAFRRAPGFFDEVCYDGLRAINNTTPQAVSHNLGVSPELVIVKCRSASTISSTATNWSVCTVLNGTYSNRGYLNTTDSFGFTNNLDPSNGGAVSASSITFGYGDARTNATGNTYVAYLFATCPGVQYINSYVGDGTTGRTINCGFTGGARFVCIKATSTTGSWWTFDSARGIVTNNDPALQLNSTAAEVTSADAIDTASSGFIVNQESTCSLNASGVSYLVWAIA
jgi:hypothetical protein